MMKILFLFYLIISISILFGCVTPSYNVTDKQRREPSLYNDKDVEDFIGLMDKEFNTLGFKGLHLGMTYDQVNALVKNTPWGYLFKDYSKVEQTHISDKGWNDDPQYRKTNFLKGDQSQKGWTWSKIGCEGPDGNGRCYWIDKVLVRFYGDKLVEFVLSSHKYSADKIDTMVKDWGRFALKGLISKYGNPIKAYHTFDEANIFTFKSGFSTTLYIWEFEHEVLKLTVDEYESQFSCSIIFQDIEGIKNIKEERSKGKTEF